MTGTPIYVFDEHNEAFYFWQKAKFEGHLKGPLDLFHVDAHSDIDRTSSFRSSLYFTRPHSNAYLDYYRDFTKNELGISDFIRPAVLAGLVKDVYFIYPKWRRLRAGKKRFNISSVFGEGRVLKYDLRLNEKLPSCAAAAFPDLKWFDFHAQRLEKAPEGLDVILDIDFDYFACVDSVQNSMAYELEITEEQFARKGLFMAERTLPFSAVDFIFEKRDGRCFCRVFHKKGSDLKHLPPEEEVGSEIERLAETLERKKIRPAVITLCRSCHSGYCPEDYGAFIERRLKKRLEALARATPQK